MSSKICFAAIAVVAAMASVTSGAASPGVAPAGERELRTAKRQTSLGVQFARYQQTAAGIPVLGAQVVVTNAPGRDADLVVDDSARDVRVTTRARVAEAEALQRAISYTGTTRFRAAPLASLAILPHPKRDRLVWRVLLPALVPLASFEVLVDAGSGQVVRVRNFLRRAVATAALFDPNPVERQGSRAGLSDSGDADSPQLASLRTPATLPRLLDSNPCSQNPFTLRGHWVLTTLPTSGSCSGLAFSGVQRQDDRFEALMAYYHVDRVQAYLQGLGFTGVRNRQQVVNANIALPGQPDADNSFFDPITGEMGLGTGGVDDGEDGDVIVHEYGHAIQDDQVPGFGESQQAAAMGEGFGDYLAATISALFSPTPEFDVCVAEWDALAFAVPVDCLRRTDGDPTVAQVMSFPCSGEVHCAGEVWSSALWDIRAQLGAATTDRLVIQSHFSLTPTSDFHEGSRALLAADGALNGGANHNFIRSILLGRGLLDPERLDDTPTDAVPLAVPGQVSGSLNAGVDQRDIYRVSLAAGAGILATLTGASDFDLRLHAPGTTNLQASTIVASSTVSGTSNESFSYIPAAAGDYFLEVAVSSGSGSYTLTVARLDRDGDGRADNEDNCPAASNAGQEDSDRDGIGDVCDRFAFDAGNDADRDGFGANADNCPTASNPGQEDLDRDGVGDVCDRFPQDRANDADRDGIGANRDNCPSARNSGQSDWDGDGRGDACDRDARITLSRVLVRGARVRLRGERRPADVELAAVRALVQRQACKRGSCRYRRVRVARGARAVAGSRFELTVRLRAQGRYRFRLQLVDPNHERARSQFVSAMVRR